ncbi:MULTISPECIES: sensor histidine kinase [Niastella]|uniref:histidine kinase n=1 Tax=Niastella soli TaxID=2821487 RepID=A0ABS3YXT7_9BACT|nr:PAS domain S-box protein [Niastella soli]MBO9202718.1 PAS domain S-box protein [Niastella soli]
MQTSSVSHSDDAMHVTTGPKRNAIAAAILNGVIENTEGYTWIIDKDLHYIVCNRHLRNTIKQLSGKDVLPGDEVIDCMALLDDTHQLSWTAIYQEAFNGTAQRFAHSCSIQQNTVFFDITITPVREDNKIIALSCSAQDITERKKAEEGLRQSELKFRSLIENSTDIILMANEDGNIFYSSPSAKTVFGYEEADYIGRHVCSFVHSDSLPAMGDLVQNLMQHPNELYTIDLKVYDKQGNERWVQGLASNMLQRPGINALVGNFRDITERKKAEELLKASEDLYRNLFYNSPLPKAVCDAETMQFLEVNEATIQLYGYSREEFMQMKGRAILSTEEPELPQVLSKEDNPNQPSILRKHIKKNKEPIFVEVWAHAINYKGRSALLILGNDITEKIQLQNQLVEEKIQRQQEVAKAVIDAQEKEREALGRELHDNISQVLTTARLYLNCAKDSPATQEAMIKRSCDSITNAIEEIRRLSKSMIETFHKEVGLEFSLNDLIEKIRLAQPFTISLYFAVPDEPNLDDKLKKTIFRIVQEQLNNTIKHADASEVQVAIVQKKRQLLITIADDGKGFDPSHKRNGIGITNIISRTELFNGRVKIESSPGKGCRMQVSFTI